ncbi:HvfC/BufC N-terminal domain-containing protein [Cupriavidus sp. CP313]
MNGAPMYPSQREMAEALLAPSLSMPGDASVWKGPAADSRFAVYRNNVIVSFVDALASGFPVVQQLVGEAFFRAMAWHFAQQHPPRSPVMAEYGSGFGAWIAGFHPAMSLPYLADMARLEWARLRALHAADAEPLATDMLGAALRDPVGLANLRLTLHPSLTLMRSPYAVVSVWSAHQTEEDSAFGAIVLESEEAAIVMRQDETVTVLPVPVPTAGVIEAIGNGRTMSELAGGASGLDLATALATLIRNGAIVS